MNKKGFTLIEITIALLILAIGIVGILALFPVGFDASGRASSIIEATLLAQELIEDAKRVGYNGFTVGTTLNAIFADPHANYEYDLFTHDTVVTGLKEIVARVYWPSNGPDANGESEGQRLVELSIYLAQYEM
ncbi:MAG: type II secretion system protein [Candidatus Omnitrophota bacterium]